MTKHDAGKQTRPTSGVAFTVPGKPVGKGRPRAARRGQHIQLYTPEKTVSYESTVALVAMQAMADQPLITAPVDVVMRIALPIPMSWSKRKRDAALGGDLIPTTKPDMDNVIKVVFDAINGVVWSDDTQVADLSVRRRYGATPGVSVIISAIVDSGKGKA